MAIPVPIPISALVLVIRRPLPVFGRKRRGSEGGLAALSPPSRPSLREHAVLGVDLQPHPVTVQGVTHAVQLRLQDIVESLHEQDD